MAGGGGVTNVIRHFHTKQEFTTERSPEMSSAAERAISILTAAGLATKIQAPEMFSHGNLSPSESMWEDSIVWASGELVTANLKNESPDEMWHETAAPASPHPSSKPAYYRWD